MVCKPRRHRYKIANNSQLGLIPPPHTLGSDVTLNLVGALSIFDSDMVDLQVLEEIGLWL